MSGSIPVKSRFVIIGALSFWLCTVFPAGSAAEVYREFAGHGNQTGECVILLHGMGRTHHSMAEVQAFLADNGYHTFNIDYPSTREPIEKLAAESIPPALLQAGEASCRKIHFVTHSLGGIVVRYFLKNKVIDNLGHVVMLSPPNQGSAVARELKGKWYYRWLNGPAGQQLAAGPDSVPARLGAVSYSVGIIAGSQHAFFDTWLVSIFDEPNDGKVSVSEARLEGMSDFLVVEQSHPFIMDSPVVHREILHYLSNGRFSRRVSNTDSP